MPRESSFEDQWGLTAGIPQDWVKQKLHPWRTHTESCADQDPGKKASDRIRDWVRHSPARSPAEEGAVVAHSVDKYTGSGSSGKYSLA